MTYQEQLKTPKWQYRRLKIMERDNLTCQLCGNTEDILHIHHKEYISGKNAWEYPDELLTTFCVHCHDVFEFCKKQDIIIKKCQLLYGDEIKSHLICVTDKGMCLIWHFVDDGEVNGKNLVIAMPFNAIEIIFNFLKSNQPNG